MVYIVSSQRRTVALPPASSGHPATPFIQEYASHGSPINVGPEWSLPTARNAIARGTHTSTLAANATTFFQVDIIERSLWGFSIVLTVDASIFLFITLICI